MPELISRTHQISRVLQVRGKLIEAGEPLIGDDVPIDILTNAFHKKLPKGIRKEIVRDSLLHLAGARMTPESLKENAWRLAGNLERLATFHSVPPWNRQPFDEYVPVQVLDVNRVYRRQGDLRYEFTLQVLAGTPTPLRIRKSWPPKYCQMLSNMLGFSKPWRPFAFRHPRQMIGLRFYVLIEQKLSRSLPDFDKLWSDETDSRVHPSSCYTYNQQLIRLRNRDHSQFECPGQFPTSVECHECPIGYSTCPLATHPADYQQAVCRLCDKVGWCDSAIDAQLCLGCYDQQLKSGAT